MEILEFIKREKLILNINSGDADTALKIADVAVANRIRVIGIEMNFKESASVIKKLSEKYETKSVVVGAVNARTKDDISYATDAGAKFVISLFHFSDLIGMCTKESCLCAVGALTPTEVNSALDSGANAIYIAPCSGLTSSYIKFMTDSFGDVSFFAGGGITLKNFREFLNAGASALVIEMVDPDDVAKERYKKIGKDILGFIEERDVME